MVKLFILYIYQKFICFCVFVDLFLYRYINSSMVYILRLPINYKVIN